MKKLLTFFFGNLILAGVFLQAAYPADYFLDEFMGIQGNYVGAPWLDQDHPGESSAGGANFLFGTYSHGDVVTTEGSQGYCEVYRDLITVDTSVYQYLNVKVDSVTNTATTWQVGIGMTSNGTWQGYTGYNPWVDGTTVTGYFSYPMNSAYPTPGVHTFSVVITVRGVSIDTGELDGNGDPIYDYYGYDGDTASFDYIILSTSPDEPTPAPPSEGTHKRKHCLGSWDSWIKNNKGWFLE